MTIITAAEGKFRLRCYVGLALINFCAYTAAVQVLASPANVHAIVSVRSTLQVKKMQSETADFAPGAATWRTRRNITSCLIVANWHHYVKIC